MFRKRRAKPSEPSDSLVPYDAYFWMSLLAGRLARRERLRALDAPEDVLEAEEALVEEAKSNLSPGHILYILGGKLDATKAGEPS
jgi:hypothetical protein